MIPQIITAHRNEAEAFQMYKFLEQVPPLYVDNSPLYYQ